MTKYCECGHLVKDHGDCGCVERVDGKYCKCSIPAVYFVRKNFVELEQEWKKAILANVELAKLNADYFERLQKIEAAAVNLFQACADLPVAEMDRMEAVINAMSEALK